MIESLVSVALLAVIMLTICRFFSNAQTIGTASLNTTELYQDARVILDVVTTDLRGATARRDDIPGQHIYFHQPDASSLWFVAVGDAGPGARSSLIELAYRFEENQIERAFVGDASTAWNIYGQRDDASDQHGYQEVADGIMSLEFLCYNARSELYTPSQTTTLPVMVVVSLKMMDGRSYDFWQRLPQDKREEFELKTCREFRKTVSLGGRGS
ncbi:MAG: hypothetical protein HN742_43200 [Lentisphaerae bacterium]|nr:hypothetical protein [Lentisphaerota bacterium]MBT4820120.1 hypothetical protein [Lentisphaerota bacterium]MBT5606233.1 hypothetical protein [Lentisphaerota bacterium]MBT7060255.1 hypothetical protein [Lentisphaerota bacterium]MBT7848746.1 hypothetical protein [Lentisphaerota bacterium]